MMAVTYSSVQTGVKTRNSKLRTLKVGNAVGARWLSGCVRSCVIELIIAAPVNANLRPSFRFSLATQPSLRAICVDYTPSVESAF